MKNKFKYLLLVGIMVNFTIALQAISFTEGGRDEYKSINDEKAGSFAETEYRQVKHDFALNPLFEFEEEDFGDAPENAVGNYPTTLSFNGARHTIDPGIYLGNYVDPEPDGQPGINADCDDTDCLFPSFGDDEDGVTLPASIPKGSTASIIVFASVNGFLDAWMDFNIDGDWADASEHIFTNTVLTSGSNTLSITVPANAASGQSYIRFRFRDYSGTISYDGLVLNGEVEDYKVNIIASPLGNLDYGDAPDPSFPTLLANNGARHTIVSGIFLGNKVDPEPDGQPGIGANCDDTDCLYPSSGDDEDGITMPSFINQGSMVTIVVSASVNGFLDAWMDFNIDGDWTDSGEHIYTNTSLTAGSNSLTFNVPANAVAGQTYARFRFRDFGTNISFDGLVQNGEVEDYSVFIQEVEQVYDFGDAPENSIGNYPTTLAFNGARHIFDPTIFLGSFVDPEPDGQPAINADCDDTDCIFPSFGDDEDGVNLPALLTPGSSQFMTVTTSVSGYLDVWMDFNVNNSWADPGEHFIANAPMGSGPNTLLFFVPANAVAGQTYMRFRFRDYSGTISYDGLVLNGEVEDYSVIVGEVSTENLDFGDAPENTPGGYPTILASNGARHTIVPGIYLGNLVDAESDGQPGEGANCDDIDCLFPSVGDDEDGVIMPPSVSKGSMVTIVVTASVSGFLDGWMDFNVNNSWADAGEHIFTNTPLATGANVLTFNVPENAVTGQSYVRFRFRNFNSVISYDGLVQNGEVEDYSVLIDAVEQEYDFGDAPENAVGDYPTTLSYNGARHTIVPGIYLGNFVDPEPDGQPGSGADCDDADCIYPSFGDDEDGVIMPSTVSKGSTVAVNVFASVNGFLDAWIDFNIDGDWADTGEHIFTDIPLSEGLNTVSFSVPVNASLGQSYARFRFRDYTGAISYDGLVQNGEVEDYAISIVLAQIKIDLGVILGGAVLSNWTPGDPIIMDTSLNLLGFLPLVQPYNDPAGIWYYGGTEQVASFPRSDIIDWIVVELRETAGGPETADGSTIVGRQAAFLLSNGSVVSINGNTLPQFDHVAINNLYIVIWHRNHLGIMSANPMSFDGDMTYSYDFIPSSGAAYGTNAQIQIAPGYYGMIPGDALPEGQINQFDKGNVWNIQAGNSGYFEADLNLNGQVENVDKNDYWTPNTGKGIQIP